MKIRIKKLFTNFLITFASVFATLIIIICSISEYIFSDMILLKDLILIGIVSLISSVIILLIFKLNKINVVFQYILVYSFLSFVIILLGYLLYIYDLEYNLGLLISILVCLIIGLVFIVVYCSVKNKIVNNSLNANLKNFKERDK